MAQLTSNTFTMPTWRLLVQALAVLCLLLVMYFSWDWLKNGDYERLYPDMTTRDLTAVAARLESWRVPFRIEAQDYTVSVPSSIAALTRMRLASDGLPRDQRNNLSPENDLTQLAMAISSLPNILEASVYIPENKSASAQAAVMVRLAAGAQLAQKHVNGIRHLVAAHAGIDAQAVSIIDEQGLMPALWANPVQNQERNSLSRRYESATRSRIDAVLTPLLGTGKFRTSVSQQMNDREQLINQTVAVVVDYQMARDFSGQLSSQPLSEQTMLQIETLTKVAIGYDTVRGDKLTIVNAPFLTQNDPEQSTTVVTTPVLWFDTAVRVVLVLGALGALAWFVLRPGVNWWRKRNMAQNVSESQGVSEQYDARIARLRQRAENNPGAVANLIKDWMSNHAR